MRFSRGCGLALGLGGLLISSNAARADSSLGEAIAQGKPIVDVRARYEGVDDASKSHNGDALSLRARLGYATAPWHGLSLTFDIDAIAATGAYNNTRNGKTAYPTIGDPAMIALNRLQLAYASDFDTTITVGRQRLQFGDQRFIGNSGWRQHEQTFDAVSLVNRSVKDLMLAYAYIEGVNRVFGPDDPKPATGPAGRYGSDSHLFNAVYTGVSGLKLEAYVYLLDLDQHRPPASALAVSKLSTATEGVRAEYRTALDPDWSVQADAAFAHQSNYAGNPLHIDVNYWVLDGGVSYQNATLAGGYEAIGGNGAIGFSTPLASLHPFDGWADMFLTTPVNGIDDLFAKGSYAMPGAFGLKGLNLTLVHHDFSTDRNGYGIGTEWDASVEIAVDKSLSFFVGGADYQGSGVGTGGFKDKNILWLQTSYVY